MKDVNDAASGGNPPLVPSGVDMALYAARCGYSVFPIRPGTKAPYSKETIAAPLGIDPTAPAGFHHARNDEPSIRAQWADDRANAHVGLAMGNGRMAIDSDEKDGKSGLATMAQHGWTVPATAWQRTPSGGVHFIVAVQSGTVAPTDAGALGEALDRRGDGGYILLYDAAMLNMPIANAPEWSLVNARISQGKRIAPETAVRAPTYQIAHDALQSREPGDMDRNEWLLFSGGFYTATIGLADDDQVLADWQAWNVEYATNDPRDNANTWEGFRRNGTNGDFRALADLGNDANAKGWRWLGGIDRSGELPAVAITRPTIDAASFFIRASDMEYRPPEYHIIDLIETDALAVLFGDPATGKSFIAIDMACCVATGHDFHSHLTKQGAVFYIAGEGHNGIKRRLTAWETHNDVRLDDAPLYVSQASAKFLNRESAVMVENAIAALTVEHGAPKLIFVDTLARNFGDGDENSQKDMTIFVNAMDVLRCRFPGCTVVVVHHSGHGDKDRARGSSVLKGAVDAEFKTGKTDDVIKLENLKMKDGSPPRPMEFKFESVGHSVALTYLGEPKPSSGGLSNDQRLALEAFNECGTDIVATPQWRLRFYAKRAGTPDAIKQAFQRARKYLVEIGSLITDDDSANYRRAPMPGMIPPRSG